MNYQEQVNAWMIACFGQEISGDQTERADRFIEEAVELAQATGYSAERAHALVDYVFSRPVGEIEQEVGGVMVTLAALCNTFGVNLDFAKQKAVDDCWQRIEKIREKQKRKPTGSALPQ